MSDYNFEVSKAITLVMDYEEYNLDEEQAEDLYALLGLALGKDSRKAA